MTAKAAKNTPFDVRAETRSHYQQRQPSRRATEGGQILSFDRAKSPDEIKRAAKRCFRGAGKKTIVKLWKTEMIEHCCGISRKVESGEYKTGKRKPFVITDPKKRTIQPPLFKDCVWQNAMCSNGLYDDLTKPLIYDNGACQKRKGTEFSILRMHAALERYFRVYGTNKGWAVHLDVRGYFRNTPNAVAHETLEKYVKDKAFIPYADDVFATFIDERLPEVAAADPRGKRGTGLGSPISQLVQLAILNEIDQKIVRLEGAYYYQRTMDDFVILSQSKEAMKRAKEIIKRDLAGLGLEMTDKGGMHDISRGFYYLKRKFRLSETGRVYITPSREKFQKEKRALKKHKERLEAGEITIEEIKNKYECWASGLMILDAGAKLRQMDAYFKWLFGVEPEYKCKPKSRRYKTNGSKKHNRAHQ